MIVPTLGVAMCLRPKGAASNGFGIEADPHGTTRLVAVIRQVEGELLELGQCSRSGNVQGRAEKRSAFRRMPFGG